MKTVDDIDFFHKKALVRVDFNVPLDKSTLEVTDDNRIRATLPTIKKILQDGGSCILMSHLGRPKEGPEDRFSLRHTLNTARQLIGVNVQFANDCVGGEAQAKAGALKPGEVLLLENLRFHKGEEKGDPAFAEKLSKLGDVYVNDAFGTAHRAHASTATVAQFFKDKCAGLVMAAELANAGRVLTKANKPFTAIMGGAKISDKILIIENLLDKVDHLIIGGGMGYTFFKALGGQTGNSLVEEDKLGLAKDLIRQAKDKGVELHLPMDSIIADKFDANANIEVANNHAIKAGWMGLDIGPQAAKVFSEVILASKTILWNGPMGVFEMEKFEKGTKAVAEAIVKATEKGAFSLIGGGDSAAAVAKFNFSDKVSYVSTGGGALLEYFEGKELPGVKALG
ncbi:MAG: phosphoglycerate kinase [Cyclobacteriaceae bacterium]|nr:phosphoglycerate kinase [Cyclobacteriaceae bacterium]MCB0498226.1 phosphoglycerate kinase [Cyclobacteriaceae bacterium]MCB9238950.1 phosphoglycerate kinase [Flammeovirgaceae bacterium]MCO5270668.1 phosphoglycerate kinase [Cyclobacteriaceae bacterium]MCW5900890.1 phosphoglycerate kinase [Cyclobacteriaceae bacterium]